MTLKTEKMKASVWKCNGTNPTADSSASWDSSPVFFWDSLFIWLTRGQKMTSKRDEKEQFVHTPKYFTPSREDSCCIWRTGFLIIRRHPLCSRFTLWAKGRKKRKEKKSKLFFKSRPARRFGGEATRKNRVCLRGGDEGDFAKFHTLKGGIRWRTICLYSHWERRAERLNWIHSAKTFWNGSKMCPQDSSLL